MVQKVQNYVWDNACMDGVFMTKIIQKENKRKNHPSIHSIDMVLPNKKATLVNNMVLF